MMTSSILRIIFTTCVASNSCCCFPISVSNMPCSFMSHVPACFQRNAIHQHRKHAGRGGGGLQAKPSGTRGEQRENKNEETRKKWHKITQELGVEGMGCTHVIETGVELSITEKKCCERNIAHYQSLRLSTSTHVRTLLHIVWTRLLIKHLRAHMSTFSRNSKPLVCSLYHYAYVALQ